jgi:hypothetical protein
MRRHTILSALVLTATWLVVLMAPGVNARESKSPRVEVLFGQPFGVARVHFLGVSKTSGAGFMISSWAVRQMPVFARFFSGSSPSKRRFSASS